jgi:hypothetical protein
MHITLPMVVLIALNIEAYLPPANGKHVFMDISTGKEK